MLNEHEKLKSSAQTAARRMQAANHCYGFICKLTRATLAGDSAPVKSDQSDVLENASAEIYDLNSR